MPEDLPWYKRDGLMTYIDQVKYKYFYLCPDAHIKNTQIINFEMVHTQCCGQPCTHSDKKYYQTVTQKDMREMPEKDKKVVGACLRSTRKVVFVDKKLAFPLFR